jgi:hypothetical protein
MKFRSAGSELLQAGKYGKFIKHACVTTVCEHTKKRILEMQQMRL